MTCPWAWTTRSCNWISHYKCPYLIALFLYMLWLYHSCVYPSWCYTFMSGIIKIYLVSPSASSDYSVIQFTVSNRKRSNFIVLYRSIYYSIYICMCLIHIIFWLLVIYFICRFSSMSVCSLLYCICFCWERGNLCSYRIVLFIQRTHYNIPC